MRSVASSSSSAAAASAAAAASSIPIPTSTSAAPKPILILFDLDNAPIPSETPEIASAVVSVLARKMEHLLRNHGGGGGGGGVGGGGGGRPPSSSSLPFPVRAAAFANAATVRGRPGLSGALSSAGVSLVTVPATRNAADAMVVSCAAGALASGGSGGGDGEGSGEGGGGGLSGLVFCSADNYFSGFLRYASHKGVRTFVAGDFDNGRRRGGRGASGGGGRRRARSGEKKGSSSCSSSSGVGGGESAAGSSGDDGDGTTTAPWRKKELPAAADGAALWSDVLDEARELLLLNR